MNYFYGEWDGIEFPGFQANPFFQQLAHYIMAYGEKALDAMQKLDPDKAKLLEQLVADGLLQNIKGRFRLTPKAVGRMQQKALEEMFADLRTGVREGHDTSRAGRGTVRTIGNRPYVFGDPVAEIDMGASLRNAVQRAGTGLPIRIRESDLEVHNTESTTSCSTVLMLDMSGSMMRYGRFYNAKKVALAMQALIRWKFPTDTLDFVGFYSIAEPIPEHDLAMTSPKPVSISDWEVDLSFDLEEVMAKKTAGQETDIPEHFTNLQMGLALARKTLARRGGENRQIFIITDGQPTAHVEEDTLRLLYPPSDVTVAATLREALLCVQQDIRIVTFALTEDYYDMSWVGFVDQLTKLVKGMAFYCAAPDLGSCIMESYLGGSRKKKYIG
jgi:uncharacterized protein with von Willebrand factor type A (vWA) domain